MKSANDTDMNNLPIHITPHAIALSVPLRKFIEKKISRVSRFAGDVLSAEVVVREKSGASGLFSVSARLALPGRDVQASAVNANFYAAINQLVSRLARLSRKRKTRFEKRKRRAGRSPLAASRLGAALGKRGRRKNNKKLLKPPIVTLSPRAA